MKKSVAIATYNGEKYIVQQLESIRNQTVAVDEVIICDDCSKDNTVKIVSEYIREYELGATWRIEVNPCNKGYASNFVGAVKKTTGDFIFLCDQDDIWVPDRVEKMSSIMESNIHILLLCSEFESFVSSPDAPEVPSWERKQFRRDNSLEHLLFNAHNIFIGCQGCSMCIRREFWENVKDAWYEGWAHDEFVWRMALCLNGLYVYHGITLKRRLHSDNVTMHKMRDLEKRIRFLEDLKKSHEATLAYAREIAMPQKASKLIERNIIASQLRIDLLRDKKLLYVIPLTFRYFDCFHSRKSIPVELYMAIKSKWR